MLVSPISAWEIGLLARKKAPVRPNFSPDPITWFQTVLQQLNVTPALFDTEIAFASSYLPEPFHKDPADRFLIATARTLAVSIVTRDRLILDHADEGHVDAISC